MAVESKARLVFRASAPAPGASPAAGLRKDAAGGAFPLDNVRGVGRGRLCSQRSRLIFVGDCLTSPTPIISLTELHEVTQPQRPLHNWKKLWRHWEGAMGLGDSLLGKRKQYNGRVDSILKDKLKIDTNHESDPRFPGVLSYLNLIDKGWHSKFSAEETATMISCGLFLGMKNNKLFKSASEENYLRRNIIRFVQINYEKGNIKQDMYEAAKQDIVDWSI
jgi:hypothetical protein